MSDNMPPERSMDIQKDLESAKLENKSFVSKAVRETAQFLFPVTTAA